MSRRIDNYAAFYALLAKLPGADKEQLVSEFTRGRTTSLREMTDSEYRAMIAALRRTAEKGDVNLKKMRSEALRQLQLIGVNTAEWSAVNAFTSNPRIAGKVFAALSVDELRELTKKLRAIKQKREAEMRAKLITSDKYNKLPIC